MKKKIHWACSLALQDGQTNVRKVILPFGHFAFWEAIFPFLQVGCDLDIQQNLTCNDSKHEKLELKKNIVWNHCGSINLGKDPK